jgi:hypothetical protein
LQRDVEKVLKRKAGNIMSKLDFKKTYPKFYSPKTTPDIIDVPEMKFIMVDGKGNPNIPGGEYQIAVGLLYSLSYGIKMGLKSAKDTPEGYTDYTVAPLEGLWWLGDLKDTDINKKDKYRWCSMIRQPDFITEEIFNEARENLRKKKPDLPVDLARFESFREGLCVQVMHHGPYDEEPATVQKMDEYVKAQGYRNDFGSLTPDGHTRTHHEIYLTRPDLKDPGKMRTILRHPIRPMSS